MSQLAAADAGRSSQVIRQARAGPDPDQTCDTGGAGVVVSAQGTVEVQGAVADGGPVGPKRNAAQSRMGRASQARADQDHRAAAAVAVAADGLVVVECAAGNGGHSSKRSVDHTPSAESDLDDVGAGGAGVIAADGP